MPATNFFSMLKERLNNAFKAFTGSPTQTEDFERRTLTILENLGFGKKGLKSVIDEGYSINTYVYSIINRIAESAADIPIIIEHKNSNGEIEIITEGDFYDFVHKPNPKNNYKSLTYQSIVYQLTTGNELQLGIMPTGSKHFSERWNLAPQYIKPKVKNLVTTPLRNFAENINPERIVEIQNANQPVVHALLEAK